jgi:hypothetical protein
MIQQLKTTDLTKYIVLAVELEECEETFSTSFSLIK